MTNKNTEKKEVKSAIIPDGELAEVQKEIEPKDLVAVVYNGNISVRTYTLADHGENFRRLARQFADKKSYTVKVQEAPKGIACPSCGHFITL